MSRVTFKLAGAFVLVLTVTLVCGIYGCGGVGGGDTVRLSLTRGGLRSTAQWVAVQNGDVAAAWTMLAPMSNGVYEFTPTDPAGRYGVAVVTMQNGKPQVRIIHATRQDGMQWTLPGDDIPGNTITCSASGVPSGGMWTASMFGESYTYSENVTSGMLDDVPSGTRDMAAALFTRTSDSSPSKMIVERTVVVARDKSMHMDFTRADAFVPETHSISAVDTNAGSVDVYLATRTGAFVQTGTITGSGTYAALPVAQRAYGDLYVALADETTDSTVRSASAVFKDPADKTLTLPAEFGHPSEVWVSRQTTAGVLQMKAAWTGRQDARIYELTYQYEAATATRLTPLTTARKTRQGSTTNDQSGWTVLVTPNWLALYSRDSSAAATHAYTLPDLHEVSGWNTAWNLPATFPIQWSVGAYLTSANVPDTLKAVYREQIKEGQQNQFTAARGRSAPLQ